MDSPNSPTDNPHYDSIRHPPAQGAPGLTPNWLGDTITTMARRSISDESRPLLAKISSIASSKKLADVDIVKDEIEEHRFKAIRYEAMKLLKMSGPVIVAYMLQNSLQTGSILVVGRMVYLLTVALLSTRERTN